MEERLKLYNGDCLEVFKNIESNSVNLVLIDPPYNINKDKKWDKWKTVNAYVEFMGQVFLECQRVLKDNGSFYFFHNDFLQIVELQNYINKNTEFVFKQFLVWNKRFEGGKSKKNLDSHCNVNALKNYRKMAEYCLFYTLQDGTGLEKVKNDLNNFQSLRQYFKEYQQAIGLNKKQIIEKVGQKADHCFRWNSSQWDLPTKETYLELKGIHLLNNNFKIKEYEELRQEYEDLRQEYEDSRYTFNNLKQHHSVMNFDIPKIKGHITPKPVDLLEYIIKTSSNEDDLVLDCFMGSGSTGVACINTNRKFIGIEKDENYFNIAKQRIEEAQGV